MLYVSLLFFILSGIVVAEGGCESPYMVIPEPAVIEVIKGECVKPCLISAVKDTALGKEGYQLSILPQGVKMSYGDQAGRFYGLQTLNQIEAQYTGKSIPCGKIIDKPRYGWRGMMLDPARHFLPIADIKKFMDVMAYYKYNKLHLHLTDDQGWRLEMPKYPRLKSVGSKRAETNGDGIPHEGMYTKKELKDLVQYAAKRNIEVIPEIDAPGHNQALAVAYPELLCFPNPDLKVKTAPGISKELVCPGNPEIWKFYADVMTELRDIFPSRFVHLGGDEAPEDNWMICPKCKQWRGKVGIKEPTALKDGANKAETKQYRDNMRNTVRQEMVMFFEKLSKIVSKNGKETLFWYEEPIACYPKGSTVYTWRMGLTPATIAKSREEGLKLICSAGEHCYLDYPQHPGDRASGPLTTLKKVYDLDPGYGLPQKDQQHIIGIEATIWGEFIPSIERAFYMTYPRAHALAEAGWSPMSVRSWDRFQQKMKFHNQLMQKKWGIPMDRSVAH